MAMASKFGQMGQYMLANGLTTSLKAAASSQRRMATFSRGNGTEAKPMGLRRISRKATMESPVILILDNGEMVRSTAKAKRDGLMAPASRGSIKTTRSTGKAH